MDTFWTNTIWYLLLLVSSVIVVIITTKNSADVRFTSAFSFAALGLAYWLEALLVIGLSAYTYHPMITPWDPFQDAVLGNIFSQVSVSTTAVLYCVLGLRKRYIFIFAGLYFLLDVLFVGLGIYEHNWYQSIYTFFGFTIYCWIIKKWYVLLTDEDVKKPKLFAGTGLSGDRLKKWLYVPTLFFAVFAGTANTVFTTQKVAGLQILHGGFFSDRSKDHTTASLIYGLVMVIIMMLTRRKVKSAVHKTTILLLVFTCHLGLYAAGILQAPPWWIVFAAGIDVIGFYFCTVCLTGFYPAGRTKNACPRSAEVLMVSTLRWRAQSD